MDGGGQGVARRHGAVAEEDPDRRRGDRSGKEGDDDGVDVDEKAPPPRRTSRRVASLDVFRGLTVAVSNTTNIFGRLLLIILLF